MRHEGTIIQINAKGYGFIRSTTTAKDVFFHASKLADDLTFGEHLVESRVTFCRIENDRGYAAVDIQAR